MTNKYYPKNRKKDSEEKHMKNVKTFQKKKKTKGEKKSERDIKIFIKNKSRNYLSIWKIII